MSKSDTITSASNTTPSGQRIALVVGCNGSTDEENISILRSAERDAENFVHILRSDACNFPETSLLKGSHCNFGRLEGSP
jgi:hypothetical protein